MVKVHLYRTAITDRRVLGPYVF